MNWLDEAIKCAKSNESAILITVAEVSGSSPREAGAKMLVREHSCIGTIGGGALELDATKMAREYLSNKKQTAGLKDYPLGPSLQQCCGGFVRIVFEAIDANSMDWLKAWQKAETCITPSIFKTTIGSNTVKTISDSAEDFSNNTMLVEDGSDTILMEKVSCEKLNLWIFGAGHVAQALITTLTPLDFNITIVDGRKEFVKALANEDVTTNYNETPFREVENIPPLASVLVMTHSHAHDFDICHAALSRKDLGFIGLIGSATKKARFIKRLRDKNISNEVINTLTCPIGIGAINNKKPAAIAISVAAQLLAIHSKQSIKINDLITKTIA